MSYAFKRSLILILLGLPLLALAASAEDESVNAADPETLVKDRRAVAKYVDDLLGSGPVPEAPAKSARPTPNAGK